jgi:hypothetical protein
MLEKTSAEGRLPVETLERVLLTTAAGKDSPMFQMLVEVAFVFIDHKDFETHMEDIPKEFPIALVVLQREDELKAQRAARRSAAHS